MTVTNVCPICGTRHQVVVDRDAYVDWKYGGRLAQHAMPDLTPVERDQLITRLCPPCQTDIGDDAA